MSLIMNKDIGEKYSSDQCLTSDIFGHLGDTIKYLSDKAANPMKLDVDSNTMLVISKVN